MSTISIKRQIYFASVFANILDNQFTLFGLRFGVSVIIDLIPGVGDLLDALLSSYIVWLAIQLHSPKSNIAKMLWNIFLSFIIGLIPFLGDAAYMFYKPNLRNIAILKQNETDLIQGKLL